MAAPPSKLWYHQSVPLKADEEQEGGSIRKDTTNHFANSNSTITTVDLTEDKDEDELESAVPDDMTQNKFVSENIAE
eukprot:10875843-Ditylum_brightwellii.AAC.1